MTQLVAKQPMTDELIAIATVGEVLQPTYQLRWLVSKSMADLLSAINGVDTQKRELQQAFVSTTGRMEWRTVPSVLVE